MSGTSLDGIDVVLVDFSEQAPKILAKECTPYPSSLRNALKDLFLPGENEIDKLGELDNELGLHYSAAVLSLLDKANILPATIRAIGCHGQTIRHRPNVKRPFTLQIGNGHVIAVSTGIDTICDFRRRDMALGGQGAPLAPKFHEALFANKSSNRVIVNIGGISNISYLPASGAVTGFDSGPGNGLLDAWAELHTDKSYDEQGEWAASGEVVPELLEGWLETPFFSLAPPKSTGKEQFSLQWLTSTLEHDYPARDVQRTLTELTAQCVMQSVQAFCADTQEIFVCGGGVHNDFLMKRLSDLSSSDVLSTQAIGVDPDWVEAVGFAWLAKQTIENRPSSIPKVTGAKHEAVLGTLYRA